MLPLLALGLLGGAYGQQWFNERRNAELIDKLKPLLGEAPQQMGPEGPQGQMGLTGGSGLLADPADPMKQLQFAQGVMGLPGGRQALASFDPVLGRALQSRQYSETAAKQASQFQQTESRLVDQFAQSFGLQKDQAAELVKQHQIANQQWSDTFEANRADAERRNRIELANLGISHERLALEGRKGLDQPKLPTGYMYTPSASGIVAAPMPGTEDYGKVKAGEETLQTSMQLIDNFMDTFAGKQKTVLGKQLRRGGTGTELWGEKGAQLSTMYGQLVSNMGKLRELGVLQKSDMEDIMSRLPDPTAWSGPFRSNTSIGAAYNELRSQFDNKLQSHRVAYPWLVPPPPAGTVPVR